MIPKMFSMQYGKNPLKTVSGDVIEKKVTAETK